MSSPIDAVENRTSNGWALRIGSHANIDRFSAKISCSYVDIPSAKDGDGIVIIDDSLGGIVAFARIYRKRTTSTETTYHFDSILRLGSPVAPDTLGITVNPSELLSRVDWSIFESSLQKTCVTAFTDLPTIEVKSPVEQAYIRELLQIATMDDLLGPACGPEEEIVGMSVRDRYLVGKLAPRTRGDEESVEGLKGVSAEESGENGSAPTDLKPFEETGEGRKKAARRRLPGEEFSVAEGHREPDDDDALEVDASKNQSFAPSSIGLTVCVDAAVEAIELVVSWGRYRRTASEEQENEDGKPLRAWKRIPSGGKITLPLTEGKIGARRPDPECPEVVIQGTIRPPLPSGDRLVTLFLVNDQRQPQQNQDEAWLFQPEITLRHPEGKAVFRRRPVMENDGNDIERESLEMIYRGRVEFAVGHSVSVSAEPSETNPERAIAVRTSVLPQYEVAVTETPGLDTTDRPAMRRLVDEGFLDMRKLGELVLPDLIAALSIITDDYESWIKEQGSRISKDVTGYDDAAKLAMDHCTEILERLREGIGTLQNNDKALKAFRFANFVMASQRIRSIYALEKRRGKDVDLTALDVPKNRSWRPFQLAFILLSIPALADPTHKDRTKPIEAYADLLWFPTGGGKTEAYLGVAAFTMAIRRIQGSLGGLDNGRGLSVIMRYTLRLLTLQQFQRATTLICAMEVIRRGDESTWGNNPFSIGLWVGQKVTPNDTEDSHEAIVAERGGQRLKGSSPAQLTSCPWCGSEINPKRDIEVRRFDPDVGKTLIYCGDKYQKCEFSKTKARDNGLPVVVVDDEIYRRPPSILIATVDKFAMMSWRGQVRTLFGRATNECSRHGLLWPGADCTGNHQKKNSLPSSAVKEIARIRPPDLIIQDEFHLISGPLGTMVGLYETAVDELASWDIDGKTVRPKVIASTATVRKAAEQVNNVFLRKVAVFPPHGLDVEDNFFSVQRSILEKPGRRYLGICSPGSARPAVLIRVYTALLTAAQALFDRFGPPVDPWMTVVGYFNSLRELGGMRRLSEDDVQTRAYRVLMSRVARPGLAQRSVKNVDELTSRVSNKDIPAKLDQLEIAFKGIFDSATGKYKVKWGKEETQAIDVALATNMLSVGVDVNRLGLMVVNGQPKNTAEYIQATSRVGRSFPGLVCTVLTWSRPRDLSHYETFEHYHATFYKHVEAQSVTPFSPRALDRGLTGTIVSWLRLDRDEFNPNLGAQRLDVPNKPEIGEAKKLISERCWLVTGQPALKVLADAMVQERCDDWVKEATRPGRRLGYDKGRARKTGEDDIAGLLKKPGVKAWDRFTVPMSMREVEPGVRLIMDSVTLPEGPAWKPKPPKAKDDGGEP